MLPRTPSVRIRALMLTVALLGLGVASGGPAHAVEGCVDGFDIVEGVPRLVPEDIHISAPGQALIGGRAKVPEGWAARLVRGDEDGYSTVATKVIGSNAGVTAVGGSRASGTWVAGYYRQDGKTRPLILRWSADRGWERAKLPDTRAATSRLVDIDAHERDAAWAVGYRVGDADTQRPHVLRWDGQRWRVADPRLAQGERGLLAGVSTSADGGTWIAGTVIGPEAMRPYLARRRGGSWVRAELPDTGEAVLSSVSVPTGDDGWAVGYRITPDGTRPLLLQWDGDAWSVAETPRFESESLALDISVEDGIPIIGGSVWDPAGMAMRPFLARRSADDWEVSVLEASTDDATVIGIDGDPYGTGLALTRGLSEGAVIHGCASAEPDTDATGLEADAVRQARTDDIAAAGSRGRATPQPAAAEDAAGASGVAGDVRMEDRMAAVGLPTRGQTYGAVIDDFDADGADDILLGRHRQAAALWLAQGTRFERSPVDFGIHDRHGCAAADVDGSGLPDIYCSFGGSRGQSLKANQLLLDPGTGVTTFEPSVGGAPALISRGRQVTFLDYDADGHEDLIVGGAPDRSDGLPSVNRVYRWVGPARFEPVSDPGLALSAGARELFPGDVDGDGRADLLHVTSTPMAADPTKGLRLYHNTESGFEEITQAMGITSIEENDAALVDFDADGQLDLIQLSDRRVRVSIQEEGRFRKVYERAVKGGVDLAIGDADGDGDADVYVLRQKPEGSRVRDLVFFNGGDGTAFDVVRSPALPGGQAQAVEPIDHDGNGLTDFLVLNGWSAGDGPNGLIAFYPR